jgi:hypothetical protein
VRLNRNYFGSEHGKADGDGEIGSINRSLDRAIISRRSQINSASTAYKYCEENLTDLATESVSKRSFLLVNSGEVQRDRPETEVKTLKGTRQIHQLINTDETHSIKVRKLSCFCTNCITENYIECANLCRTGLFQDEKLRLKVKDQPIAVDEDINNNIDVENMNNSRVILEGLEFDENGEVEIPLVIQDKNIFDFIFIN